MKKPTAVYPRVHLDAAPVGAVGQAGGVLLTAAAEATGLARALREALAPWRTLKRLGFHAALMVGYAPVWVGVWVA